MLPVDIYLRVSRVGGRTHLISPDEQERRARGLATGKKLPVGNVFTDLDESGGKWDRPGLQAILERVRRRESGGIIVAWLDRLSRDSEHAQRLLREIAESGGSVYAPDAPDDMTTPEGELMVGIQFQFATYVRKRAGAGFERAKANAIAQGIPVCRTAPFGYVKGADRRLEIDPDTAAIVLLVFEARATGASYLDCRKLMITHEHEWTRQGIERMLRNRVYLGEIGYGKDRRYVNTTAHKAIVDLPLFEAAQRARGGPRPPRSAEGYLLSGLVRCSGCGYSMEPTRNGQGVTGYRCPRHHSGSACPRPMSIVAHHIEPLVIREFWAITENIAASQIPNSTSGLLAALTTAERRLASATDPEMADAAGPEWPAMVKAARQARDEAAGALGAAQATGHEPLDTKRLRDEWEHMTTRERRERISERLDAAVVFAVGRWKLVDVYALGCGPELRRPIDGPQAPIAVGQVAQEPVLNGKV